MKKFLFTTIPSDDLGLLTRSLPVASELAKRGYKVAFCSPGPAPSKLIAEAGFYNLLVLSDPSFTTNARRISEKMQTYGGASEAARLIESFGETVPCANGTRAQPGS
jgi:UDP:flavonoid glycosyltransferase YjiC (YdhE family)